MEISCQLPENVLFKKATLSDFNKLTAKKLKLHTAIDNPYKICDFRPAFGRIFEDNLSDFEFWGYSDLDLVYGNLSHFISLNNLKNFDIITSRSDYVAGHFTLFRNTNNINNLYKKIIGIRRILQNNKRHFAIDERSNLTGSPIENLADKHLGLKFFVKICRSILFRIYKTRIIQFDFNQVLNKEKKNKKLNICRP